MPAFPRRFPRFALRSSLLALTAVLLVLASMTLVVPAEEPKGPGGSDWKKAATQLRPGMTAEEVRSLLGPPRRTARQLLYQRYLEQWLYEEPVRLRLDFDCRRGQPPLLLARPADLTPPRPTKSGD
jgi:hypothetical protein